MSGTILSIRCQQRKSLLPLGSGERVINGLVYYSAAWLGPPPAFEPEAVKAAPEPTRGVGRGPTVRHGPVG